MLLPRLWFTGRPSRSNGSWPRSTVYFFRAAARDHVHDTPDGPAVLGGIGIGNHLHFADRFPIENPEAESAAALCIVGAIHLKGAPLYILKGELRCAKFVARMPAMLGVNRAMF